LPFSLSSILLRLKGNNFYVVTVIVHTMAENDVAGERVYHERDLREFLGHNFVSGLRTLKPKISSKTYKPENYFKKLKYNTIQYYFIKKAVGTQLENREVIIAGNQ